MNSRLSPALAEFADGRWPDERDDPRAFGQWPTNPRDLRLRDFERRDLEPQDIEPPLHPSELDQHESEYLPTGRRRFSGLLGRFVPAMIGRVGIAFCVGVAATVAWQVYGNGARRTLATWSPQLGWLAPPLAVAAPASNQPPAPVTSAEQLAALSHSLAAVRQSVDRLAADIGRLQAGRQEPPPARAPAPPATTAAASRRPASQAPAR